MNKQKSIESDQKKGTVLLIFTKFNYNDEDGFRDFHSLNNFHKGAPRDS